MPEQVTTPDAILERFKAEAKPPATTEEVVVILSDFAKRISDGENPRTAAKWMQEDLAGRNEAWQDALDEAWQTADESAA
jgi:hypothetical protein